MALYYAHGNDGFIMARRGRYIDKSGLISITNRSFGTKHRFLCVSRPRRFGKSLTTDMLCAYYDRSCDSGELFADLKIAKELSYPEHLNRHNVIYLDITWFITEAGNEGQTDNLSSYIQRKVIEELRTIFPEISSEKSLAKALSQINDVENNRFVILIDEWDAIFREFPNDERQQREYIDFLRGMFKSNITDKIIDLAYITGILPIKKFGTESAMTNFDEFTVLNPGPFAEYVGFTKDEVIEICNRYDGDIEKMEYWYDGYRMGRLADIYNPNSVMSALRFGEYTSYWTRTETYETLKRYIDMDFEGSRQALMAVLGGEEVKVETDSFQNSIDTFGGIDDVLTCLVHLGYLSYDADTGRVCIPNEEVRREFVLAVKNGNRKELARIIRQSDELFHATLEMNGDAVARIIENVHETGVAPLQYNNEECLRYVIRFAYISLVDEYMRIEELPSGHGYADVVYLPKKNSSLPALVVELKWNESACGAISQIRDRNYPAVLQGLGKDILLVGISYDSVSKRHECIIEKD